jgi:hypothetical protein
MPNAANQAAQARNGTLEGATEQSMTSCVAAAICTKPVVLEPRIGIHQEGDASYGMLD